MRGMCVAGPVLFSGALLLSTVQSASGADTAEVRAKCRDVSSVKKGISTGIKIGPGDGQTDPRMVKAIRGVFRVRVIEGTADGMFLTKSTLSNMEAFGEGRANGATGLSYPGPYVGAMWPFRDALDLSHNTGQPRTGNDIGQFFFDGANTFAIGEPGGATGAAPSPMSFLALGGPTDPNSGQPTSPQWLNRGTPGNGVIPLDTMGLSEANFFSFDVNTPDMLQRTLEISFIGVVDIVVQDINSGAYRLVSNVAVEPNAIVMIVPAPGAAGLLALGGMLAAQRRRR